MDGNRFDQLTRGFANAASRRSVLKTLAAGMIAGVSGAIGSRSVSAAKCRKATEICRKGSDCCSNICGPKDFSGRQHCQCAVPADCPKPSGACQVATCNNGVCGSTSACTQGQVCYRSNCCTPAALDTTCLERCGAVKDNCGQTVDCGPCCLENGAGCESNSQCCGVCIDGNCATASGPGGSCDATDDCQNGFLCCSGICAECCDTSDCGTYPNECGSYSCSAGTCETDYENQGFETVDQTPGDCKKNVCDGAGSTEFEDDDSDVPASDGQCWTGGCANGQTTQTPVNAGAECSESGGSVCDGSGTCVECNLPTDCKVTSFVNNCITATCVNNECGSEYAPEGTFAYDDVAGDCSVFTCNGQGSVVATFDDTDEPTTLNECEYGTCQGGTASINNLGEHEPCSTGVCDGAGSCVGCVDETDCGDGLSCCSGTCVDMSSDEYNCGSCGTSCTGQEDTCCDGSCVDVRYSFTHCSACGSSCSENQTCCSSTCRNTQTDVDYCGDCDTSCASGEQCCGGACLDNYADEACGSCTNDCTVSGDYCDGEGSCVECRDHNDCTYYCAEGTCYTQIPNDLPCTDSYQCQSGYCNGSICTFQ